MDAVKNLSYSLVATAPSPDDSGTSLVVTAATGTRFPAVPFNATVWATGAMPTPANAEIVTVTLVATDTLTIVRAQEGTTARHVAIGDQIAATVTAKQLNDLDGELAPALNQQVVATHSRTVVRSLTITSGKQYLVGSGARLRIL